MTRRDFAWRAAGAALVACGYLASRAEAAAPGVASLLGFGGFALAILGLVLLIQGKRVPLALRIERSRHRELPLAIAMRRARMRAKR